MVIVVAKVVNNRLGNIELVVMINHNVAIKALNMLNTAAMSQQTGWKQTKAQDCGESPNLHSLRVIQIARLAPAV